MGAKPGTQIWMNGEFVPWDEASVHPLSNTMQYGTGVFEGLRCYPSENSQAIFRLQDHTERLFQSAHTLQMKIPYTKEEMNQAQIETVVKNGMRAAYIRPMVYFGAEHLGLHAPEFEARVLIAAIDFGEYLSMKSPDHGLKLKTSSYNRIHPHSLMCKVKASGHYINSILSLKEANAAGCDDALMLDDQGCIAEASAANIFLLKKGVLYTPTDVAILEGITRDTIFSIAEDLNMKLVVKNITREELYNAEEAFVTGTAAEIKPIAEVDGRVVGSGKRGPVTKEIQSAFFDIVSGKNEKYSHWLSPVRIDTK